MELAGYIIDENASVYDAMNAIDKNGRQIAYICREGKLAAAISDGDVRRYILKNGDLSLSVQGAANYGPVAVRAKDLHTARAVMRRKNIKSVPVVNDAGALVGIEFLDKSAVVAKTLADTPVVIMAGGRGTRLAPYTDVLPKPLIPIGEKTITEHIIDRFAKYGCSSFYIIVNHKRELIKAYFKELSLVGARVTFVDEQEFQGTGGGLKLLEGLVGGDFFMTNCDILIEADYADMMAFHQRRQDALTMVCATKKVSVPYGTVTLDEAGNPRQLTEKPEYVMLTNTGLYIINESFISDIARGEVVHITDLIQRRIDGGGGIGVYPVGDGAWLDMGQMDKLAEMRLHLGAM